MKIYVEKVVINIGTGASEEKAEYAATILQRLTNRKPVKAKARKRIPTFGIRKGSIIGAYVTLRGKEAEAFLDKALDAVGKKISEKSITTNTFSFGIKEYIDLGLKYDPKIGILGMDVCVTFAKPGIRVARRKRKRSKIGKNNIVTKEEIIQFLKEKGVNIAKE
jgi:large subunit ribosomal protein L5